MRHDRRRHHESHELDSYGRESRRIAWLVANGFTHRRSFFDLQGRRETPLPPAVWPTGVAIARYRPGGRRGRPDADLRRGRTGRGARALAAIAGGLAIDAHARVPRLGGAARRAPRRLRRRPRVQRRARMGRAARRRPRARGLGLGRACCCTRSPSSTSEVRPRSPSACRARTRTPSACTATSASRSNANGACPRGRQTEAKERPLGLARQHRLRLVAATASVIARPATPWLATSPG